MSNKETDEFRELPFKREDLCYNCSLPLTRENTIPSLEDSYTCPLRELKIQEIYSKFTPEQKRIFDIFEQTTSMC